MTLPDARVVVLVRQGCHLCDDALAIVSDVCTRTGATWASLDVDDDERLRAEFTDHVPVTFVDGTQFSLWFVDGQRLSAALA